MTTNKLVQMMHDIAEGYEADMKSAGLPKDEKLSIEMAMHTIQFAARYKKGLPLGEFKVKVKTAAYVPFITNWSKRLKDAVIVFLAKVSESPEASKVIDTIRIV